MNNSNNNSLDSIKQINNLLKNLTINLTDLNEDKLNNYLSDINQHNIELIQKVVKTIVLAIKNGEININDIDVDAISANFFEKDPDFKEETPTDNFNPGCYGWNLGVDPTLMIPEEEEGEEDFRIHIQNPEPDDVFFLIYSAKIYDKNKDGLPSKYTCEDCKAKFGSCFFKYAEEAIDEPPF